MSKIQPPTSKEIESYCKQPKTDQDWSISKLRDVLRHLGVDNTGSRNDLQRRLCSVVDKSRHDPSKPKPKPKPTPTPASKKEEFTELELELQFRQISRHDPTIRVIYLKGPTLDTFSSLVKLRVEHGGMIDINRDGEFDRAIIGIGRSTTVDIGDMTDFEVIFHTHPVGRQRAFEEPSKPDINVSVHFGTIQTSVVFAPDAVYTIYSPLSKLGKLTDEVKKAIADIDLLPVTDMMGFFEYVSEYAKYGIYIFRYSSNLFSSAEDLDPEPKHNWPMSIPLFINPQEPNISLTRRGIRKQTPQDKERLQLQQAIQKSQREERRARRNRQRYQAAKLPGTLKAAVNLEMLENLEKPKAEQTLSRNSAPPINSDDEWAWAEWQKVAAKPQQS